MANNTEENRKARIDYYRSFEIEKAYVFGLDIPEETGRTSQRRVRLTGKERLVDFKTIRIVFEPPGFLEPVDALLWELTGISPGLAEFPPGRLFGPMRGNGLPIYNYALQFKHIEEFQEFLNLAAIQTDSAEFVQSGEDILQQIGDDNNGVRFSETEYKLISTEKSIISSTSADSATVALLTTSSSSFLERWVIEIVLRKLRVGYNRAE